MTDESQQPDEHVRTKDAPAAEKVGEELGGTLAPSPLEIVRIENTEPGTLWGPGSKAIVSAPDTVRLYVLTQEQLEAACLEIADADQGELETMRAADDVDQEGAEAIQRGLETEPDE